MKKLLTITLIILIVVLAGCEKDPVEYDYYMGFSSTPPQINVQSFTDNINNFDNISSIILFQETAVFNDKLITKKVEDFAIYKSLAGDNKVFIMIDPLNPTDRRKISNLIEGRSFKDALIRDAYRDLVLKTVQEVQPDYLGLASEINSYQKANPKDFENFVSLYNELYPEIKQISPDTKVFVSFQYEDLQGLWTFNPEDIHPPQWDLIDKFEKLDVFAISTYPHFVFKDLSSIPHDFYSQIRDHTNLPIAVAELGYGSLSDGTLQGSKQGQIQILELLETQLIGSNFEFLIWYLHRDYDVQEFKDALEIKGLESAAADWFSTIGIINYKGEPKPAYDVWSRLFENSKKD